MKLHKVFTCSRLLLSGALILALYATPVTYDFEHGQWQAKVAYADDGEENGSVAADGTGGSATDDGTDVGNDEVIIPNYDDGINTDDGTIPSDGTSTDDGN